MVGRERAGRLPGAGAGRKIPRSPRPEKPSEPASAVPPPALLALVSDLHANLEAVDAAWADLDAAGVPEVLCLGDVIGYGASPREVIERVRQRCAVCLLGNHDAALLDDREALGFNERALQAIDFSRRALDPEQESNWPLWDWLGGLVPAMAVDPGAGGEEISLVHASPRSPLMEYLLPNAGSRADRLAANFAAADHRLTFFGHTHHPGWFAEGDPEFHRAEGDGAELVLEPDRRYLINVGSVGQPRDGDPRLAFALYDGGTVRWRRLAYDNEAARRRILAAADLPDSLGDRLLAGR
ncbi:MAG: metallophosphoesterase [Planctomycetota bacterium]|nr:MAG: metallophosphoesterase [Planctomycetota bacterium]